MRTLIVINCYLKFYLLSSEIAALERTVLESVRSSGALEEVASVWSRLGLSDAIRQTRRQALANNIGDLLSEIVQGEQKLERSMETSLEANVRELTHLCQQLSLPPEEVGTRRGGAGVDHHRAE